MKYNYVVRKNDNVMINFNINNNFVFKRYDVQKTLDLLNVSQTMIQSQPVRACGDSGCVLNRSTTNTLKNGRISLSK